MAQSHQRSGHPNKSHHKSRFFGGATKTWALIAVIRSEVGTSNPSHLLQIFLVKRETCGYLDENCIETEHSLANGTTHWPLVMLD